MLLSILPKKLEQLIIFLESTRGKIIVYLVYNSSGRYEDSYVSSMSLQTVCFIYRDTYGSYSAGGMYGNHASINYVFGQLGAANKSGNVNKFVFVFDS